MTSSNKTSNKVSRRVNANTNNANQFNRADIIQMLHDNFFQMRGASSVVDLNNNGSMANLNLAPLSIVPEVSIQHQNQQPQSALVLKDFTNQTQHHNHNHLSTMALESLPTSRYEKPTSRRQERRRQKSRHNGAINRELTRLRDLVPSVAHSEASDLTIINEAISLICDLESKVFERLQNASLP